MPLNFNFGNAERNEINLNGQTIYAMSVMSIHVGMPEITAANAEEFYLRAAVVEALIGPFRGDDKGEIRFTLEEVRAFAGLKTNVKAYTPVQFGAQVRRLIRERSAELVRDKERASA